MNKVYLEVLFVTKKYLYVFKVIIFVYHVIPSMIHLTPLSSLLIRIISEFFMALRKIYINHVYVMDNTLKFFFYKAY